MSTSPLEFDSIVIPKIRGRSILDLGCGYGKWGFLAKKYYWLTADGDSASQPRVVGVDRFLADLLALSRHRIYDEVICADAVTLPLGDKKFDTVIACELIEHLPKDQGLAFIQELHRVARQCIIISTPAYEDLRGGSEGAHGFNPYEAHVSHWKRKELKELGFRCYGVGLRYLPPPIRRLSPLFTSLTYPFPQLATHLIGVKLITS